jgi:hypothetical protein
MACACIHFIGSADRRGAVCARVENRGLRLGRVSQSKKMHIVSRQRERLIPSAAEILRCTKPAWRLHSIIGRSSTEPELNNAARMCPHA